MSTEAQSNTSSYLVSASSKETRVSFGGTSTQTPGTSRKTPLEAARAKRDAFVVTLLEGYQPFLKNLTDSVLKHYSSFFYKNEKFKELDLDPNHVATSVINDVKLTLVPPVFFCIIRTSSLVHGTFIGVLSRPVW